MIERLKLINKSLRIYLPDYDIEPYEDKVTMARCVRSLDAVLSRMYGCSFRKEGKDAYVLRRLALFDETSPVKQLPWAWGVMDLDQEERERQMTETNETNETNERRLIARYHEKKRLEESKSRELRIHRECMKKLSLCKSAKGTKDIRGFGILKML